MLPRIFLALLVILCTAIPAAAADQVLRVGSKRFTESYVLGEIIRQSAAPLVRTEHLQGMGNTAILFSALKSGSIDVYPEYLGTIALEILRQDQVGTLHEINRALSPMGLGVAVPLGFNNTYSLAMRGATAPVQASVTSNSVADSASSSTASSATQGTASQNRGNMAGMSVSAADAQPAVQTLSDLKQHPGLKFGLSHEFIGRADGWPGLAQRYGLPQQPRGLDHGIAYEALGAGQVDVIDIYSTDAKIARLGLQVLQDDKAYFPRYDAVLLYRLDLPERLPAAWKAIASLQGRIDEKAMIAMNAQAELDGRKFDDVAHQFLQEAGLARAGSGPTMQKKSNPLWDKLFDDNLWRLTRQHVSLVFLSVAIAALLGIPLGMLAASRPLPRQLVMAAVGMLQTIPSLALLAMLIPLLGMIGSIPALIALCLYALLPIVRNTCTGLEQVSPGLRQAALALGLNKGQRLLLIDLPLAMPIILAGLKTATVMSVGTTTIAAFIGAGGYGERISIGLALNDNDMLLAGALPAAALALLMQGGFELLEWSMQRRRNLR